MMKDFKWKGTEVVPISSATWEKAYEVDTSTFIVPDHCPEMVEITDVTWDEEPEAFIGPDPLNLDDDDDFSGEGNDIDLTTQVIILAANLLKVSFCPLMV